MDPRTRQKERSYLLRSEAARIRIQTKRRYASAGSIVEGSGLPPDTATHRYNAGPRVPLIGEDNSKADEVAFKERRHRQRRRTGIPGANVEVRSMPTCRQIHGIVEF